MGIKPDPLPFPNSCPSSAWANGQEPDAVLITIEGVTKKSGYPQFPDPPNGSWLIPFYACGTFYSQKAPWTMTLAFYSDHIKLQVMSAPYAWAFYGESAIVNDCLFVNNNPFVSVYESTGIAGGDLQLSGVGSPVVWTPATLIGVPPVDGYFAEQPGSSPDSTGYRYASHLDGTNVHLKLT